MFNVRVGLSPQPLVADGLMAAATLVAAGVLAAAATRGVSTARTAASWLVIRLTL